MIRKCDSNSCYSPTQDALYGIGMRVMNECKKGSHVRCTVCQKEYSVVKKEKKEKEEKK